MTAAESPTISELESLVDHRFPGDSFTIEPFRHWLTCDSVLAGQTSEGNAHPVFVYLGAIGGMGISIDELFSLCRSSADHGGVLGECEMEILEPLVVGGTYQVSGRISDVSRKTGGRAGVFDIVKTEFEVIDSEGKVVAAERNSFVFPRGEQ